MQSGDRYNSGFVH